MALEFGQEIKARTTTLAEAGTSALTADEIRNLNGHRREMMEYLGYDIGENWSNPVPMTGMNPRIYIMQTDDTGTDKMMTLSSANVVPGSPEFWEQVQLGNVYAFPSGAAEPVQMQVDQSKKSIGFSKPVTRETQPAPPVKRPTLWMRFAGLFGAYKKERTAWANRNSSYEAAQQKLDEMKENRQKVIGENGATEKELTDKMCREYDCREDLKASTKNANATSKGMEQMTSVYHPQPWMLEGPGYLKSEKAEGLYTQTQFDSLKVYPKEGKDGIDLDKITVGGEKLSPEDFAAATMFAMWQPDVALRGKEDQMRGKADQYAEQSILGYKDPTDPTKNIFKKEDVNALRFGNARNFWTCDLFIIPPRDNEGSYFKETTNEGRRLSIEAFKAYADGDKTKLAKLLADGLNMAAEEMRVPDVNEITPQIRGLMECGSRVLDMMDKDPALKAEVMKQGLKPDNMTMAEGLRNLNKLYKEGQEAEKKLAEARMNPGSLDQKQLNELTKTMLKPKLAFANLAADNFKHSETEDRELLQGTLIAESASMRMPNGQTPNKLVLEQFAKDPSLRPEPKPGEMYFDTASDVTKNLARVMNPNPQSLIKLGSPEGMKDLDKLTNAVMKQEGLEQKDADWIYKEFNHKQDKPSINLANSIIKVAKNTNAIKDEPQKDVQKDLQKQQGSIADRAKMFEQKVPGLH